jgi:hypothetical protein
MADYSIDQLNHSELFVHSSSRPYRHIDPSFALFFFFLVQLFCHTALCLRRSC